VAPSLCWSRGGGLGLVLLGVAGGRGLLEPLVLQIVLAAMLLSMIIAPLLMQYADRIVLRLAASEWMQKSLEIAEVAQRAVATERHVVICGFGRSGQHLAKMLEQEGFGYVALDVDPDLVREAAAAGDSVVYGDAARREMLAAARIRSAAALVVTFADASAALVVLHHARELKPDLAVIVRTEDDHDLDRLMKAGATEVVPEIFEGSLMLGSHALVLLGVPVSRVVRRVREARDGRYRFLRRYFHSTDDEDVSPDEESHQRLHSVSIDGGAAAAGKR